MIEVGCADDKYTVLIPELPCEHPLKVLRYGEEWRDCTGDNLILALAAELSDARLRIQEMLDSARIERKGKRK